MSSSIDQQIWDGAKILADWLLNEPDIKTAIVAHIGAGRPTAHILKPPAEYATEYAERGIVPALDPEQTERWQEVERFFGWMSGFAFSAVLRRAVELVEAHDQMMRNIK